LNITQIFWIQNLILKKLKGVTFEMIAF